VDEIKKEFIATEAKYQETLAFFQIKESEDMQSEQFFSIISNFLDSYKSIFDRIEKEAAYVPKTEAE
jgi:hypothetical protein